MPRLAIPKEFEPGIRIIRSLPQTDVERVAQALKGSRPASELEEILSLIGPILEPRADKDLRNLVETLRSLYILRAHERADINDFVNDLTNAVRTSQSEDIQTSNPEELTRLKSALTSLLTVPPLLARAKADLLKIEFDNTFCDARVITDIRPVWGDDVNDAPVGALITNTLRIEYHHGKGRHEQLYVYLERKDIDTLLSALTRAKEKVATLENIVSQAWMKFIAD